MKTPRDEATLTAGDGIVTILRRGRSEAVIARILGENTQEGRRALWLDRLVHVHGESHLGSWNCAGAITTILTANTE